eukprot:1563321-Amphidinium_carterae.4
MSTPREARGRIQTRLNHPKGLLQVLAHKAKTTNLSTAMKSNTSEGQLPKFDVVFDRKSSNLAL